MLKKNRRAVLLAGVAVTALMSGAAVAQEADGNTGYIGQFDTSNFAVLSQDGANLGFIYQYGGSNDAAAFQTGTNSFGSMQVGDENAVLAAQEVASRSSAMTTTRS